MPIQQTVHLHLKVLMEPTRFSRDQMVAAMRQVYEVHGIGVNIASVEFLNLPALVDLEVGACRMGVPVTSMQQQLFSHRNSAGVNDVCVYFVRSTVPPLNGCAAHPPQRPGAVVVRRATLWTLGHEVGHVLGLPHVSSTNRLMVEGTENITNPPPDLVSTEVTRMLASSLTR